jgi:hypothetical protein
MQNPLSIAYGFAAGAAVSGILASTIAMMSTGALPSDAEGSLVAAILFNVVGFGLLGLFGGIGVWLVVTILRRWLLAMPAARAFFVGAVLGVLAAMCGAVGLLRYLQFASGKGALVVPTTLAGAIAGSCLIATSAVIQAVMALRQKS